MEQGSRCLPTQTSFIPSVCEPCIYIRGTLGHPDYAIICVFVDDMEIFASTTEDVTAIKDLLAAEFNIKDLGELKYFLGIEIIRPGSAKSLPSPTTLH